jgi:hypothetical protein
MTVKAGFLFPPDVPEPTIMSHEIDEVELKALVTSN